MATVGALTAALLSALLVLTLLIHVSFGEQRPRHDEIHDQQHHTAHGCVPGENGTVSSFLHNKMMGPQTGLRPVMDGRRVECENNRASGFPCKNVHLESFVPLSLLGPVEETDYDRYKDDDLYDGPRPQLANDVWGWTDPETGSEYALVGMQGGTSFVDITNPNDPRPLAFLKTQTYPSFWRDVKTYGHHAYVVSEALEHGVQIFDLRQLEELRQRPRPRRRRNDYDDEIDSGDLADGAFRVDLTVFDVPTAHYDGVRASHNIFINEETGIGYVVGDMNSCDGGMHIVNLKNVPDVEFIGCHSENGYVHDVQCVVYNGPCREFVGREICLASTGELVSIIDVTDLVNGDSDTTVVLSTFRYFPEFYVHQGWLTEDHRFFLVNDEADEIHMPSPFSARTIVCDVSNLRSPYFRYDFFSAHRNIDHNLYIKGNHVFQAHYRAGLRILRLRNALAISRRLEEVAYFDVYADDDEPEFNGAWGVYPFFKSGSIVVSGIEQGLFVLHHDAACGGLFTRNGTDGEGEGEGEGESESEIERVAHTLLRSAARLLG